MKLLLENWREYLNEQEPSSNVQRVLNTANAFLDELGEGFIEAIYLVGSRASDTPSETSDWDYLVVGDDFDKVEDERIARAEEGNPFPGLDIDVAIKDRPQHLDIIFSSDPPSEGQVAKKVWEAQ